MYELANKVKNRTISDDEISKLVDFTLSNGGIEYAEKRMNDYREAALQYISKCEDESIGRSLKSYIDYVIERNK